MGSGEHDGREPPGWGTWLIELVVPPGPAREGLLGDLSELFEARAQHEGRTSAVLWYTREVWGAVGRYGVHRVRESVMTNSGQGSQGAGWMDGLRHDLRHAVRGLIRAPLFAATAIGTLGLGIGGTTAIFTVVDTVLLRPPLWESPDRIVNVWTTYPHWQGEESLDAFWDRIALSYPEYDDWASSTTAFTATAAYTMRRVTLTESESAEPLSAGVATASLLAVLGIEPALGRWFEPGEDVEGIRRVVLGHDFWSRRFGGDVGVIGRTIRLQDEVYSVIGVLPEGFALRNVFVPGSVGAHDVWLPLGVGANLAARGDRSFDAIGRLADGVAIEAALAESTPVLRGDAPPERRGVRMMARDEVEVGAMRGPLTLLLAASAFLLLIACLNVATMLLGASLGRRSEVLTRMALGARRLRLVRQLLTESALLGTLGAAFGAGVGVLLVRALASFGPALPVVRELTLSPRVFLFASVLGVSTGLLFGLAPALSLRRATLVPGVRGVGGPMRRERRLQAGVVVAEVGLTMVLLVGAGLLTRSLLNLSDVDPGFRSDGVAVVDVAATTPSFTPDRVDQLFAGARTRLAALPGVERVGGVSTLPMLGPSSSTSLEIDGVVVDADEPGPEAQRRVVFPGYHRVMSIPLLAGRYLDDSDGRDDPLAMVISQRLADMYWPDESALGGRIRYDQRWWTIVGVVADVKHEGLESDPVATYYVPHAQGPMRAMTLVASTSVDPASVIDDFRSAVWAADPNAVIRAVSTLSALVDRSAADQRYRATLVVLFAGLAALLSAVGVFGVTARAVGQRSGELGVRVAMGAGARGLTWRIVGSSALPVLVGVGLGLAAAARLAPALGDFLFGVTPSDPIVYGSAGLLLLASTVTSSWVAARRIIRLDPTEVLRRE